MEDINSDLKILYISSVCSQEVYEDIQKHSIKQTQFSIQKFHTAIINGMAKNKSVDEIQVLSGRPIGRKNTKKICLKKIVSKKDNISFLHIGFLNIKILKQIGITVGIIKNLIKWANKNKNINNKIIICDGAYVSVTPFVVFFAKKMHIKKIAIVADIYAYMSDKLQEQKRSSKLKRIIAKVCNYCWKNYDGYVLLTEQMNNIVNPLNKQYVIMEGIADIDKANIDKEFPKQKYIMYAGGLHEKYGLKKLVDAFNMIDDNDYELHLYGQGDIVDYVKKISDKNKKIKYFGIKNNNEIIENEKKATLLINPRPTTDEYTLYSFPSKTIEYMLTGTPVLMTKLPGMPKEYYNYIYTIEDETASGIIDSIISTLNKDISELINTGRKAKQFIITEKNNIKQSNKILSLIIEILR